MAYPNFKKIMEEVDAKWTSFILGLLSIVYFVGKSFLQFFSSVYGWIIIGIAIAIIVSPEINEYVKNKIMILVNKFRKPGNQRGVRMSDGSLHIANLFREN